MPYYAQSTAKVKSKDEFMLYLKQQLEQHDWTVDLAVGSGDSRIDLAIQHPEISGQYLTGILVDGDDYAKAATARDRDQLRPTVLKGLGWKIIQLWTVEWWLDPKGNLGKLNQQLEALKRMQNVS